MFRSISELLAVLVVASFACLPLAFGEPPESSLECGLSELAALDHEHQQAWSAWRATLEAEPEGSTSSISDDEFLTWMRSLNQEPAIALAPRFLDLAEREPDERVALPALTYVVRHGGSENDPESMLWKAREAATALVSDRYASSAKIDLLLMSFGRGIPSEASERLLRSVYLTNPHRQIRATAGYTLACYLPALYDISVTLAGERGRAGSGRREAAARSTPTRSPEGQFRPGAD